MGLEEHELREWVRRVAHGEASRRDFIRTMLGLGLSGPLIADLLATAAPAAAQDTPGAPPVFTPTRRGGGGKLRLLAWVAPTLLNPHLTGNVSDTQASRVVYEPLAAYNPDGDLIPILAEEIPSVENGGLLQDGTSVTWRLKQGVAWHDGKPCTAADVIFTWEYAADPATAAASRGSYENIRRIDKLNDHAIKVVFKEPTPFWYDAFCGGRVILPRHLFADLLSTCRWIRTSGNGWRNRGARARFASLRVRGSPTFSSIARTPGLRSTASAAVSRCPILFSPTCGCGRPLHWPSIGAPSSSTEVV